MIKLYGIALSNNVNKVRYCLNYLNLHYEWAQTNPMKGENQTPEYLNSFPTGKVPAIDIDGFKLFESNAINRYLAAANNSPIYPQDLKKRAIVEAWLDFGSIHISAALGRVLFNRVMAPMMGKPADQNSIQAGLEFLDKYLPVVERQLTKNAYLAGPEFTLADINLLSALDPCELAQVSLDKYSHIIKWRNGLKAQAFYQKCYKDYTQFIQEVMSAKTA